MTMGRVALFDKVGGYGFIATTDGAPRIYVDGVDLIRSGFVSLAIGEELEFEVHEGLDGGLRAVNLRAAPERLVQPTPSTLSENIPFQGA
jgi:cold shock CspA family protein